MLDNIFEVEIFLREVLNPVTIFNMKRKVITVDGLAGSGKSAISRLLAEKLGFMHFSSGLLYRAIGYLVLENGVAFDDSERIVQLMERHKIDLSTDGDVTIDDKKITADFLHQPKISEATSTISVLPEVRQKLVDVQRNVFAGKGLVAEGRDMGTVIFPDADLKFFIQADCAVRVARRLQQLGLSDNQHTESIDEIKRNIEIEILERDARDSTRKVAPTVAAEGAILVDNSAKTLTDVVQYMYDAVAKRGVTA